MTKTVIRPQTTTFDHTMSGLLAKRQDLLSDVEDLKEQIAEIRNDVRAIERSLRALGYDGDLGMMAGRQKNRMMYGRGDLLKAILAKLHDAGRPLKSRDIAIALIKQNGDDPRDRDTLHDLTRRVTKSLAPLRKDGRIHSRRDVDGQCLWSLQNQQHKQNQDHNDNDDKAFV